MYLDGLFNSFKHAYSHSKEPLDVWKSMFLRDKYNIHMVSGPLRCLVKMNLNKQLQLVTSFYGNNRYENIYYEFYSDINTRNNIKTNLVEYNNSAFWADLSLNYFSNNNFTFYTRVKNVFNTSFSGIQTADLFKGLYYMPQYRRTIELGVSFKMY